MRPPTSKYWRSWQYRHYRKYFPPLPPFQGQTCFMAVMAYINRQYLIHSTWFRDLCSLRVLRPFPSVSSTAHDSRWLQVSVMVYRNAISPTLAKTPLRKTISQANGAIVAWPSQAVATNDTCSRPTMTIISARKDSNREKSCITYALCMPYNTTLNAQLCCAASSSSSSVILHLKGLAVMRNHLHP